MFIKSSISVKCFTYILLILSQAFILMTIINGQLINNTDYSLMEDTETDSGQIITNCEGVKYGMITGEIANLRERPTTSSKISFRLTRNDLFIIIYSEDNWTFVQTIDNKTGWLADRIIKYLNDESDYFVHLGGT